MRTLTETMYRTERPDGQSMQARDVRFLQLIMKRFLREQGFGGQFNPTVRETRITYRGRRTNSTAEVVSEFPLWG